VGEESENQGGGRRIAVIGVIVVVIVGLLGWGLASLLGGKSGQPRKPPKIQLLAPPPPPPPPPKFEKKPDPPKEQKEMKVEQPVPKDISPPSPELKMEGPAGDGPSAFAAGKITNEDLSKLGTGKGGGENNGMFSPIKQYDSLMKGELRRHLGKNNALRRSHYTVEVRLWVAASGALKRYELIGSTGDSDTDEAIRQSMSALQGFSQAPPANMPQPIRLRVDFGS